MTQGIAAAAQAAKSRVFVCGGSYAEQVTLDAQHDGISLYGGYDCGTWSWTAAKTQVTGTSSLYALDIVSTTKTIAIEDLAFLAPDATGQDGAGNGVSSVAAFVSQTTASVTLRRDAFQAEAGADGVSQRAAPPSNWYSASLSALGGVAPGQVDCVCAIAGDSTGGEGQAVLSGSREVALPAANGTSVPQTAPDTVDGLDGLAGTLTSGSVCTNGDPGANGSPPTRAASVQGYGTLNATGWAPAAGVAGTPGNPGQGGGGGQTANGAAYGGGGACGGCGGSGGLPGSGGGASIALLVFQSTVTASACSFTTGAGGHGGDGGPAQNGSGGGAGRQGLTANSVTGCNGGNGGNGSGGEGADGAPGGISVGIVSTANSTVTVDTASTFSLGTPGSGGMGGAGGQGGAVGNFPAQSGPSGNNGITGASQPSLSL